MSDPNDPYERGREEGREDSDDVLAQVTHDVAIGTFGHPYGDDSDNADYDRGYEDGLNDK